MAKPNPLERDCPRCHAAVGQKCKNYAGKGMAPHRERLRGGALLASFETKAAKETAKEKAEAGLFAPLVRETTAEAEAWRWRFNKAEAAERVEYIAGQATRGLKWIELHWIERYAAEVLPAEDFAKLRDYIRHTFGDVTGYGYSFWSDVLTGGKRVPLGFIRVEDPTSKLGFRAVPTEEVPAADWKAPLTKAEFYERFPYAEAQAQTVDDGGIYERLRLALTPRTA